LTPMSQPGQTNGSGQWPVASGQHGTLFPSLFDLPPEGGPTSPPERSLDTFAAIVPPAAADPTPNTQDPTPDLDGDWSGRILGEPLSPSQANTFVECAAKWYFKNIRELPDPQSGALALGTSFHEAMGVNWNHKIKKGDDLPLSDVLEAFRDSWFDTSREAVFSDDESAGAMGKTGLALVAKYMTDAAPEIHPVLVEHKVSGVIGGVKVRARIDVVDIDGRIIDSKTAAKSPNGISAPHQLQLSTYSMLLPGHEGRTRLDTVTKTKLTQFIPQTFYVGAPQRRYAESIYPMVQESLRDGIFLPNRNSFLCSRKHCPFWRACEKEFGGEVEER